MSQASPTSAGQGACWNCGQGLPVGSLRCLYCGVPQEAPSAQLVVAPHGVVGPSPAPSMPGAPARSADAATAARAAAPASGVSVVGAPAASPLGPAFAGTPAGVGARLGALTLDALLVTAVGVGVGVGTRSAVLAAVVSAELVGGLWLLQARTGLGLGNALLRLRVSRADAPFSPGVGRAFVRALVTGVGGSVLLVGAWLVEATAALDRSGQKRSWADRAARTVVVRVAPRTREAAAAPARRAAPMVPVPVPVPVVVVESVPVVAAPTRPTAVPAPSAVPAPAAPAVLPPAPAVSPPAPSAIAAPAPVLPPPPVVAAPAVAPAADPAAAPPAPAQPRVPTPAASGEAVVLSFDTGQRATIPVPSVVNLGRSPAAESADDVLVVVDDPESTVSKTHLRLELTASGVWATDGGSTNGTELLEEDGSARRLAPGARTAVDDGVRVRIGRRSMTIGRFASADGGGA